MRVLHPREVQQLLQAVNRRAPFGERDHAMLALALHTGLRVSELVGLDIRHVAHDGQPRQALHLPSELGKGGRERILPLNDVARRAVAVILDFNRRRGFSTAADRPLLVNRKHDRISVRYVQRLMEATREKAGLDVQATPHTLRHSFASRVACKTGNLRVVQQLLGHKRLSTVEIYTHPTREELEAAVALLA
jgi:site-specific recombinase XerD